MQIYLRHIICCFCLCSLTAALQAQDSTRKKLSVRSLAKDVYKNFVVVERKTSDSTFFQKSEAGFDRFTGKVIRNVVIQNLSFGENVMDTASNIIGALSRFADNLQSNTKNYIIRQLLFVKKDQRLDPFRLADNERFLRDQNFIKDARIVVRLVTTDSVDVYVRLRDVFSFGAEVSTSGINSFQASIYDGNFLGMAQRLQYTVLFNRSRSPTFGSGLLYRKTSIAGSFINVEAAYTTINQGPALGRENESSYYLKLDRPLYTPNARFAGGLQLSSNQSMNVWSKPDSIFSDYKYRLEDVWVGYNLGIYKKNTYNEDDRRRRFVALRYFDQYFLKPPALKTFDPRYTDKRYLLAQFAWYQINFYRTNYIYGFGRTEDIPVGVMRKVTIGPVKTDSLQRLYLGWEFDHLLVDKYENYWNYTMSLGTNLYRSQLQDNSAFLNISWFSHLYSFKTFRLRQFANISYSGIFKQHVYEPLYINNEYGLEHFGTDSVRGVQRVSISTETATYTRWQILGFKLGFFAFGQATMMTPPHTGAFNGDVYPAVGGGIRTRNENLIFGTIEARFTWYPRTAYHVNNISLTLYSNLRVRFTGSFVQAPWFALVK